MKITSRHALVVMSLVSYPGLLFAGGVYLEPGIGAAPLQLGREQPPKNARGEKPKDKDDWWKREDHVEYKVDPGSKRVVLIRCKHPNCVTIRSLRVGQPDTVLWSRLGAPRTTRPAKNGEFLEYDGVAFHIKENNNKAKEIAAIYILPREQR